MEIVYTPKAYLGFESPSLRQMPFLSLAFPSCFHSVLCGVCVALPRFTVVLREKSGSATCFARCAAKEWQCHGSRAPCGECVAVPLFSRTLCPFCGGASISVHGGEGTRAKVLASKQEWGGRSLACVVGKSSVAGERWRQTARMTQAASALAPASTPWYAIIPSTSARAAWRCSTPSMSTSRWPARRTARPAGSSCNTPPRSPRRAPIARCSCRPSRPACA